jgi:CopG family nickel-responsive transcriptional regulator
MEDDLLSRIGVSLPQHLLEQFDSALQSRGYSSRSEGIRDALRTYITHYEWMAEMDGERQGIITIIYDHDQRGLLTTISDIRHEYRDIIKTSLHSAVDKDHSMEVILIRGQSAGIRALAERLMNQKGVTSVKLTSVSVE